MRKEEEGGRQEEREEGQGGRRKEEGREEGAMEGGGRGGGGRIQEGGESNLKECGDLREFGKISRKNISVCEFSDVPGHF